MMQPYSQQSQSITARGVRAPQGARAAQSAQAATGFAASMSGVRAVVMSLLVDRAWAA